MIKSLTVSFISFIALDFLWLGYVVKNFNLAQLGEIGRIKNGDFDVLYIPALATYVLMSLAVYYFVLPRLSKKSIGSSAIWGAFMGFIIYGIFDMTNLAILKNYPLPFVFADMAWGTVVFATVTALNKLQMRS